jgi:3-mercaptopyruvate sulfurtransferase SseA
MIMKNIKPLLLVALSLIVSIALHAQQAEEKTVKPLPAALTKSPSPDSKSAVLPDTKQISADAVVAAPSPLTRKDESKIPAAENITMNAVDANTAPNQQLTDEQLKTLNGLGASNKQTTVLPGTENNKKQPLPKPVLAKEQ